MMVTPITAAAIDAFLNARNSPLDEHGDDFMRSGRRWGVCPLLPVALAGAETGFAKYGRTTVELHNAWGWGPHIDLHSWPEGIETICRGLRRGYLDQGLRTIEQIAGKYCPVGATNDPAGLNRNWIKNVRLYYDRLGGTEPVGPPRATFYTRTWIPGRFPWLPRARPR